MEASPRSTCFLSHEAEAAAAQRRPSFFPSSFLSYLDSVLVTKFEHAMENPGLGFHFFQVRMNTGNESLDKYCCFQTLSHVPLSECCPFFYPCVLPLLNLTPSMSTLCPTHYPSGPLLALFFSCVVAFFIWFSLLSSILIPFLS